MRILAVSSTFPRFENDTEPPFVFLLCKELVKKKHNVTVLAPHFAGARFRENLGGVEIIRFPYFFPLSGQQLCYRGGILANIKQNKLVIFQVPFFFLMEFIFLEYLTIKTRPQIIHAHWAIPQGIVSGVAKFFVGNPLVLSVHGSDVFAFRKSFFRKIMEFFMKKTDQLTVNSSATNKVLQDNFTINTAEIIPMGIDLGTFQPQTKDKRALNILAVGRLVEQKGFQYLIKAMSYLVKDFPDARLSIIGSGPYQNELERLSQLYNLSNNVEFLGSIPNFELPKFYKEAEYFIGPSVTGADGSVEAFGVVFLEALASGLVTIASNVGGVKDIIQNNVTGILVDEKNPEQIYRAIINLENNPSLRKRLIKNGLEHVRENFSWTKVAEKFELLYLETLANV
jgi:glycosyltransferase involved in cell wall biosynthesis